MSRAGKVGGELQGLGRRLAGLSAAERASIGDRTVASLELLVDRGQDVARMVVLGRALEAELARLEEVARLAAAQLGRATGPGP